MSREIEALGMLVFFVNTQKETGRSSYTVDAAEYLGDYASSPSLIFAGDGDCSSPECLTDSGLIEFFPTSIVIRRRDMALIADARGSETYRLPLMEIAADPEADWLDSPLP